ncbi:hypothetical protein M9H77_35218 [Catharanthus roseus]|uniref:Uncharacterized protein n=1 Tax=Catharanthus roseus TaxID=4058 RepID=A0ACB9ZP48_CATRO|nr:hypothetical protein M9H77_35218 [Catharanthus roseus]
MIFGFSDSPVQIQATGEQQLDRINSNRIKWKMNELCEFGLTIHETDCPTCSSGEEREESLSSRWPKKENSLGLSQQEAPFPLCLRSHTRELSQSLSARSSLSSLPAVSHTVTQGLAGTDEQVRVPKGRTENEETNCSNEERRQKVREREREEAAAAQENEMRGLGQATGESDIYIYI